MNISTPKKILLRLKNIYVKRVIVKREQEYISGNKRLKYLFLPCKKSADLAVIFSAFPGAKGRAGYNFVSTLLNVKINRLYILDEFGYDKRGAYYLSENGDFYIVALVKSVLQQYMKEKKNICFCGSSKGGTAALYYSLVMGGVDNVIIGAPQYYIGNYLISQPDHIPILDSMAGKHDDETVNQYNDILHGAIVNFTGKKPNILLHYSQNEPTYERHIIGLIKDLKQNGFSLTEDKKEYSNHNEVANYFPTLLYDNITNF